MVKNIKRDVKSDIINRADRQVKNTTILLSDKFLNMLKKKGGIQKN